METQIDKLGKVAITVEPEDWNYNKDYDKLTIVLDRKTYSSYISRKAVPACTYLTDREYWQPFSSLKEEIVMDFNSLRKEIANIKASIKNKKLSLLDYLSPHTPIMPIEGAIPIRKKATDRNFYYSNMVKITVNIPTSTKTITFNLKEYLDFTPDIAELYNNSLNQKDIAFINYNLDKKNNVTVAYGMSASDGDYDYVSVNVFIKIFKNPTLLLKEYGKIKNINKKYGKNVIRKTLPKPVLGIDYNLITKGISYKIGPSTERSISRHVQVQVLRTTYSNKDGVDSVTRWVNPKYRYSCQPKSDGTVNINSSIIRIRCVSKKYASDWVYYFCLSKYHKQFDKWGTFMKEINDINRIKYEVGRNRR